MGSHVDTNRHDSRALVFASCKGYRRREDAKFESSPVLFPVPTKEPETSCLSSKSSTLTSMLVMTCTCQFNGEEVFLPLEDQTAIERLRRSGFKLSVASWQTSSLELEISFYELPGRWFNFKQLQQPQRALEVTC